MNEPDPKVSLTMIEMMVACYTGAFRRIESKFSGRNDNKFTDGDNWATDMEGACAEMAYCKFRRHYWGCTVNSFSRADVGDNVQIKATNMEDGSLIIGVDTVDARPDDFYVLLTGVAPHFTIRGWIKASDAKTEGVKKNPRNRREAYFVSQDRLNKFKTRKPK